MSGASQRLRCVSRPAPFIGALRAARRGPYPRLRRSRVAVGGCRGFSTGWGGVHECLAILVTASIASGRAVGG